MGSQLRSFSGYDKTAGLSLETVPCFLSNMDGNYNGAGGEFFQIFDKASAPAANDVPLRSFFLPAGPVNLPSILQDIGPLTLTLGLAVGISTVNEKYTASASSYDVFGDVEDWEIQVSGLTSASGNAGDTSLLLWNQASGPKHIYEITVVNNEGITVYLMIVVTNIIPATGTRPFWCSIGVPTGTTKTFRFGSSGLCPLDYGANGQAATPRVAGNLLLSDRQNTYEPDNLVGDLGTLVTGKYKTA